MNRTNSLKVSERSLEFNVLGEVLERIRRYLGKSYVVGFTTRQEAYHGLDASLDAPGVTLAAFQFKAVSSGKDDVYRFRIGDRCWVCSNPRLGSRKFPLSEIRRLLEQYGLSRSCSNQHSILYLVAKALEDRMGIPVYYAFPLVRDYIELENRIPGIINYTLLIRVKDMPIRTVLDCRPHIVEVHFPGNDIRNVSVAIRSPKKEMLPRDKYAILSTELEKILSKEKLPEAKQIIHISPEELEQMLKEEFIIRAREEELEPELLEKVSKFAEAIVKVSFSYRGRAIVSKPGSHK